MLFLSIDNGNEGRSYKRYKCTLDIQNHIKYILKNCGTIMKRNRS